MDIKVLRLVAKSLWVLAWVVLAFGVISSVVISSGAATVVSRIGFLLGGLMTTAVFCVLMMAISNFLQLAIDNNERLKEILKKLKK